MPVYTYTALDLADQETAGTLIAETPVDGRQRLREQGLRIMRFSPARLRRLSIRLGVGSRQRRQEQVAEIARYLSLLLRASVPLAESLDVVTRRRKGRLATVVKDIRDRVTGGDSFGDALAAHTDWFDPLFVSAVRVGELTGNLEESLTDLAEYLRARQTLRSQLTGALTYPLILLCVSVGVILFLMSYVVPQLITVLAASGRPLPVSTMLLKSLSDLLIGHWVILLIVVGLLATTGSLIYRSQTGRRAWQRFQLRAPLLGALVRKSIVAQFAQQMSLLLKTGVPFVEALRSVMALTRSLVLADELEVMARSVESGSDIAPTMQDSCIFPPVVTHLVAVGQDSGELTAMLAELKTRYEAEVRLAITKFTTALEPLLIVLLAGLVGFVVLACLMPILEATRAIA